jgi:hypothetical protein
MLGLWPVDAAVPRLRRFVKPGGVYVFDDLFFDASPERYPLERPPLLEEVEEMVRGWTDRVERVHIPRPSEVGAQSSRMIQRLQRNVGELVVEHPELRPKLFSFVMRHQRAAKQLTGPCRPAVWVVRRGPGPKLRRPMRL